MIKYFHLTGQVERHTLYMNVIVCPPVSTVTL